jgi:hypothetical protein
LSFCLEITNSPPTPRRDPDVAQETWRIYYGDVYAGTIAQCVGNPGAAPMWQWRCGFYPGPRPGECTSGTAASFDQARADFEAAWRMFLAKRTQADFEAMARAAGLGRGEIPPLRPRRTDAAGLEAGDSLSRIRNSAARRLSLLHV